MSSQDQYKDRENLERGQAAINYAIPIAVLVSIVGIGWIVIAEINQRIASVDSADIRQMCGGGNGCAGVGQGPALAEVVLIVLAFALLLRIIRSKRSDAE